jgi:phosphate transport system substrate-binding protein
VKEMLRKLLAIFSVGLLLLGSSIAYATIVRGRVTVKGSDTMVIMVQRLAEEYMSKFRGKIIQVSGGGSGVGISALINRTTDIADSSRPIKDAERNAIKKAWGKEPKEFKVALDGITIYVHPDNPLKDISLEELKDIFTGKITSWKDLGWEDKPIIVYTRENSSGTYVFFKEHVLKNQDYTSKAQSMPGTASVVNAVSKEKYSIGYGGIAYAKGVKILSVRKDKNSPAYLPTEENVRRELYPISRFLYMYTCEYDDPEVKSFIDWVLSEEGQKIVLQVGYFPVK